MCFQQNRFRESIVVIIRNLVEEKLSSSVALTHSMYSIKACAAVYCCVFVVYV